MQRAHSAVEEVADGDAESVQFRSAVEFFGGVEHDRRAVGPVDRDGSKVRVDEPDHRDAVCQVGVDLRVDDNECTSLQDGRTGTPTISVVRRLPTAGPTPILPANHPFRGSRVATAIVGAFGLLFVAILIGVAVFTSSARTTKNCCGHPIPMSSASGTTSRSNATNSAR